MDTNNAELEELVREQAALQLEFDEGRGRMKDRTARGRGLAEYGLHLFGPLMGTKGLIELLDKMARENGKTVWVDLGCGHALALREGKEYFEQKGICLDKLGTYGYDAIPPAEESSRAKVGIKLIDRKYAPKIIQADIATVVFEEQPDLITAVCSLFWTKDPLQVFANAARQAKKGAVLCFDNLDKITTDDYMANNLFQKIRRANGGLPGFNVLNISDDSIVARKVSEHDDYTYGFRLVSRHQNWETDPFRYVYTFDSNSNGRKREF